MFQAYLGENRSAWVEQQRLLWGPKGDKFGRYRSDVGYNMDEPERHFAE